MIFLFFLPNLLLSFVFLLVTLPLLLQLALQLADVAGGLSLVLVFLAQMFNLLQEFQVLCLLLSDFGDMQGRYEVNHSSVLVDELIAHHRKGVIVLFQICNLFVDLLEAIHKFSKTFCCSSRLANQLQLFVYTRLDSIDDLLVEDDCPVELFHLCLKLFDLRDVALLFLELLLLQLFDLSLVCFLGQF